MVFVKVILIEGSYLPHPRYLLFQPWIGIGYYARWLEMGHKTEGKCQDG